MLGLDPAGVFLGKATAVFLEVLLSALILQAGTTLLLHLPLALALHSLPSVVLVVMGLSLALTLAVGCAFPLLALAGFAPGAAANAPGSLLTLGMLYAGAPAVLKLAAVAAMGGFSLDQARQQDLRRRIAILSEA